jgi:large subunit ribosomal protein L3
MASYNWPRRGSMAYYPRRRARKETPTIKGSVGESGALSFLIYKVGMTQVMGKNGHKGSPSLGQDVVVPATIIECPALKVFGVRAYTKAEIGIEVLNQVVAQSTDKELTRKILNFNKPSDKKKDKKVKKEPKKKTTITDLEGKMEETLYYTLLVHTQPKKIGFKKKPDVSEIMLGGTKEEQLNYAKEKIGKELEMDEVFKEGDFLDIKGVTKGKGFQGVIKRFGVKIQRPKAKTRRIVGSISPWNPSTVMFTVPRPGQMGYHNRTESNKKLVMISDDLEAINPKAGHSNYGLVKNKYGIILGSIPGPSKRCLAVRKGIRPEKKSRIQLESVQKIKIK